MENCLPRFMEMEENFDEIFDLNPFLVEIYSNGSIMPKTSDHGIRRADGGKRLKSSISWNSCHGQEIISCTNPSSSVPQLISFENSNPDIDYNCNLDQMATDYYLASQTISFSSSDKDDSGKKKYDDAAIGISHNRASIATRTPLQAQDHVMAERKRRENLSQLFIALSKVVPGLKKLDKASLLEDAINYLKALQERVRVLEEEEIRTSSIGAAKVDNLFEEKPMNNNGSTSETAAPEISARIADRHVLVKICCKKQIMGLMSRIPYEMEKINLTVMDIRIMPFGGAALDVTFLSEMQSGFGVTVKEIVNHLQVVFLTNSDKTTSILNSRR